jgi:hypothetical protein
MSNKLSDDVELVARITVEVVPHVSLPDVRAILAVVDDAVAKAFAEGRDAALANAAMTAYDMGHPEIRKAINRLIPDDSPAIPIDDDRKRPTT